MITTIFSRPDLASPEFARRWRNFAALAEASFFQDWTWVGCLAAERYPDPVLAEARRGDRTVGLALFNRRRDRPWGETLHLHESGDPRLDAVFVEHNGPLIAAGSTEERRETARALLQRALAGPPRPGRARALSLSGVDAEMRDAASGLDWGLSVRAVRVAPFVAFDRLPEATPYIETLSRNARHQIRRSDRRYAAVGPLAIERAEAAETGMAYLGELIRLHEASWHERGQPGAFATPEVRRFHAALLADGIPRGEVDLLRISAGAVAIGYLMNFRHRGVVSAYQSGFDYQHADPHLKPGLTSHHLAIEAAREAAAREYDFLAGPSRYKTSLANAQRTLHWLSLAPWTHPAALRSRLASVQSRLVAWAHAQKRPGAPVPSRKI